MRKTLTILPLCMAVSLSASILPSVTALASPFPAQICDEPDNDPGIMPYNGCDFFIAISHNN